MAKRSKTVQAHKPAGEKNLRIPGLPKKPIVKGVNNNVVYGVGALLLLGGGYYAYANGWLAGLPIVGGLFGGAPSAVTSVTVTGSTGSSAIPQGTAATATGVFSPKATTTFYSVTNSVGASVLNGTLGTNVSTFTTPLATNNLPLGPYTLTISDQPIPLTGGAAGGGGGAGQVLGINQQLASNYVPTSTTTNENLAASPSSGPSNITLG